MPLMPAPPTPTKWMCLTACFMTAPRPTGTSDYPPRGCGPAWERPGARPAVRRQRSSSCDHQSFDLIGHARTLRLIHQRQRLGQALVQGLRTEAATDHEHAQRADAAGEARTRLRQRLDLGAHRVASDDGVLDLVRCRAIEAEGDAVG